MKIHHCETVRRFMVTFNPEQTRRLMDDPDFIRWVSVDHGNCNQRANHPICSAWLTISQMQRIAMHLDIDYRFVNERAAAVADGDTSVAKELPVGVQKPGAESKVDRLRVGAPA